MPRHKLQASRLQCSSNTLQNDVDAEKNSGSEPQKVSHLALQATGARTPQDLLTLHPDMGNAAIQRLFAESRPETEAAHTAPSNGAPRSRPEPGASVPPVQRQIVEDSSSGQTEYYDDRDPQQQRFSSARAARLNARNHNYWRPPEAAARRDPPKRKRNSAAEAAAVATSSSARDAKRPRTQGDPGARTTAVLPRSSGRAKRKASPATSAADVAATLRPSSSTGQEEDSRLHASKRSQKTRRRTVESDVGTSAASSSRPRTRSRGPAVGTLSIPQIPNPAPIRTGGPVFPGLSGPLYGTLNSHIYSGPVEFRLGQDYLADKTSRRYRQRAESIDGAVVDLYIDTSQQPPVVVPQNGHHRLIWKAFHKQNVTVTLRSENNPKTVEFAEMNYTKDREDK